MLLKIKNILLSLSMIGLFALPALAPASVYAQGTQLNQQDNLCAGSNFTLTATADTKTCPTSDNNALGPKIAHLINIFSALIGIAAVVVIIYAGFRYVTSAGSQDGVKAAKDAIIYAIIGLIVVALAQAIVHFVLNGINGNG
jgi:hypothetical protein